MGPLITDADRQFLLDKDNWRYGPTLDVVWVCRDAQDISKLKTAILDDREITRDSEVDAVVGARGQGVVFVPGTHPAIGMCIGAHSAGRELFAWVYPAFVERVVGSEPDFHGEPPPRLVESLRALTQRLAAGVALRRATAEYEGGGSVQATVLWPERGAG